MRTGTRSGVKGDEAMTVTSAAKWDVEHLVTGPRHARHFAGRALVGGSSHAYPVDTPNHAKMPKEARR